VCVCVCVCVCVRASEGVSGWVEMVHTVPCSWLFMHIFALTKSWLWELLVYAGCSKCIPCLLLVHLHIMKKLSWGRSYQTCANFARCLVKRGEAAITDHTDSHLSCLISPALKKRAAIGAHVWAYTNSTSCLSN